MALTTYAELQTAMTAFLMDRTDLATLLPTFIDLAEAQIRRDVRHWRMETRAAITLAARYVNLPAGWVQTERLLNGATDSRAMTLVSLADMADMRADADDDTDIPQYYAHLAGQLELWPTPGESYTGEIHYLAEVAALSDAAPTNWLMTDSPDVYLYGSLLQSAPYLMDDARMAVWGGLYGAAVQRLNAASDAAKWSGTGLRMKLPNGR